MSPAEMIYQQVVSAADMMDEVRSLTDPEVVELREAMKIRADLANKVRGLCILVAAERFEERTTDEHGWTRIQDVDHGSEVPQ